MAGDVVLRPALASDADAIAAIMRASRHSHPWMPRLYTADEERAFIRGHVLANQQVTVAAIGATVVGFAAVDGEWIEQLYLDPALTGRGIGGRLLRRVTEGMPVVRLHCFEVNHGACRFYERHGFIAGKHRDGSANEEGLPDILYVRR